MRLLRTWETLQIVARSRRPLTSREIHDELQGRYPFQSDPLSLQTTRQDLKLLHQAGFPVMAVDPEDREVDLDGEDDQRGRHKNLRWRLRSAEEIRQFYPDGIPRPSAADVNALAMLRGLLVQGEPTGFWLCHATEALLREVWGLVNARLRRGEPLGPDLAARLRTIGRFYIGAMPDEKVLGVLCSAIQDRKVVVGEYHKRDADKPTKVDIAPQAIWFSEGRAYTIAAGARDGKLRSWRIDRFRDLSVARTRRSPDVDEADVENLLNTTFRGGIDSVHEITVRIRPEIAYLFSEFQYHPTQSVEETEDGGLVLRMTVSTGYALEEWLMGFGENAIVEEPAELRDRIRDRHRRAAEAYG